MPTIEERLGGTAGDATLPDGNLLWEGVSGKTATLAGIGSPIRIKSVGGALILGEESNTATSIELHAGAAGHVKIGTQASSVNPIVEIASQHATAGWRILTHQSLFGATLNHLFRIGFNPGIGGGQEQVGVHALYDSWEATHEVGGVVFAERLTEFASADGLVVTTPISLAVNTVTNKAQYSVSGKFSIFDTTKVGQRINIEDHPTDDLPFDVGTDASGTWLRIGKNNIRALEQRAFGSAAYNALIFLDSANVIRIGEDGNGTYIIGALSVFDEVTIAGGKSITAATGAGGLAWGLATGATALPTGNATWAGAAAKVLSLVGAAAFTLTGGASSQWGLSVGTLKLDAATLALGTDDTTIATGAITLGRSGINTVINSNVIGVGATNWNGNTGWYGGAAVAQQTITGALSAVLDVNAKAVLTSIKNALVAYGLAIDGTT